ncbi:hypothetical protein REPUB_Repub04eG0094100 [Reevesia pubescens]
MIMVSSFMTGCSNLPIRNISSKDYGALNIYGFQLAVTIGILIANIMNYHAAKVKGGCGWRISLSLSTIPAFVMIIGFVFLPDTPNSLLERGNTEKAKEMLQRIRGTKNVEREFQDMFDASHAATKGQNPWKNIIKKRYRPQLVMCILIPFFQPLTGMNIVIFYVPVLFQTLGFADDASLTSAVITPLFCPSTMSTGLVEGLCCVKVAFCLFVIGLMTNLRISAKRALTKGDANIMVILVCVFCCSICTKGLASSK